MSSQRSTRSRARVAVQVAGQPAPADRPESRSRSRKSKRAVDAAAVEGQPAADSDAALAHVLAESDLEERERKLKKQQEELQQQMEQLQQLRASPAASPQRSPQLSPHSSPPQASRSLGVNASAAAAANASAAAAEPSSRFAKKEPRANDLREYDGAAGAKLDAWLDELGAAIDLFRLNGTEAVDFGASRLRGAARQWWNTLGAAGKAPLIDAAAMAAALRLRFQPITTERVAREQLRSLRQGSRSVNDYIADFQRLHALLPDMGSADALFAFESGLVANLAEKLRVHGTTTLQESIAMAARVGGLMAGSNTPAGRTPNANQMEIDSGDGSDSRLDRIEAILNALTSAQGGASGMGAKTQTQREYQQQRNSRGGFRGGRGGRFGGRGGSSSISIPGVPAEVVEQRRSAGQCFRCGSADHRSLQCPNAISASGN
jgi:hypothetical protein